MSETQTHHTLHDVVDNLKHRLHDAGHKISEAGHNAGHKLSDVSHNAGHKISDASHSATHKLSDMGHKVGESFQIQHLALCKVCHAELATEDVAQGCCTDKEGCSCRAFTARCW